MRERVRHAGIIQDDAPAGPCHLQDDRRGQVRRREGPAHPLHGDPAVGGEGQCFQASLIPPLQDQQASFRGRVLDGDHHQALDQPVGHDLARQRLRYLDDGREVELLDRGFDGRGPGMDHGPIDAGNSYTFQFSYF